ncbi:MAG: methyltransferase domain-containing protein [Pseudomonadota bacterium]|nr:MAG: methyltransferase domain-containing protein [Pseudomonadota bacterium]
MAILWQRSINGRQYEVRSAGNTRRLYTDGVFHSQFNPRNPLCGGVWDLLLLPALFSSSGAIQRVLVLGVGGGAVIHQLARHVTPREIVGIELNPVHLTIARRFFGLARRNVALVQADARRWLRDYDGPPFDLIIDDLYGEQDGEPLRAVAANAPWFTLLHRRLSAHGTLVFNFVSRDALRRCGYFVDRRVSRRFRSAWQFTTPLHENRVAAFLRGESYARVLRNNLKAAPGLGNALATGRLRYCARAMRPV